jgi:hypothetical protein
MTPYRHFRSRQLFIEAAQAGLIDKGNSVQRKLFNDLIRKIVDELHLDGKNISQRASNFNAGRIVDNVFDEFQQSGNFGLAQSLVNDFMKISNQNDAYYGSFGLPSKRYIAAKKETRKYLRKMLGINTDGTVTKGGYIDNLIRDQTLRTEVKNQVLRAVQSGMPRAKFTKTLSDLIKGSEGVDGAMVRHLKTFVYDTYAKYDRANNKIYAVKLGMRSFIYSGGLVEQSRDFCIKHDKNVYTLEEAEKWKDDPDLPKTKQERKSGVVTDYMPIEDLGRWNCRHLSRFIPKAQAIKLRPDLKEYYKQHARAS